MASRCGRTTSSRCCTSAIPRCGPSRSYSGFMSYRVKRCLGRFRSGNHCHPPPPSRWRSLSLPLCRFWWCIHSSSGTSLRGCLQVQSKDEFRLIGRRALLQGALGVAAMTIMAACGGNQPNNASAACVSNLKFPPNTPPSRPGQVVSKVQNVPLAWTEYPKPYVTMPNPPGKGETVTTFQILFSAPPAPMDSNPWWQQLNKRLGVTIQPTLADSPDYAAKLNTLAAGGSFPDITYINFNQNGLNNGAAFEKFVAQGAFNDLTPY